jgi:protein-tyrosine phosphatase
MGMEVSKNLPPPPEAVAAAAQFGVSIDRHKSRRIEPEAIASSDMIIVMEASQLVELRKAYPDHRGKIFLLTLFSPGRRFWLPDIPDPYGKSLEQFRACYQVIQTCLDRLFEQVIEQRGAEKPIRETAAVTGGMR